ncbi:hypothetical protein H0H87_011520, partial [Tephrocybe sp. NHM501043]
SAPPSTPSPVALSTMASLTMSSAMQFVTMPPVPASPTSAIQSVTTPPAPAPSMTSLAIPSELAQSEFATITSALQSYSRQTIIPSMHTK